MNEQILVGLPYLIAVYMVRDWLGKEASEELVGWRTGLLVASFCCAQVVSSLLWGHISDKWGRKWLIVMSNVTSMLSVAAFGLAPTYTTALAARLLGGFFNCTFLNVKAMLGEITDASNQDIAMSYLGISVGLGSLLAPLIGGTLAHPCQEYGDRFILCGPTGFLNQRPYFLPCFAVAVISCAAGASSIFLMQETLPSPRGLRLAYYLIASEGDLPGSKEAESTQLAGDSPTRMACAAMKPVPQPCALPAGDDRERPLAGQNGISPAPKDMALDSHLAWSAGLACTQDPEMALQLDCRPGPHISAPWYASRQVLLTLGGYGLAALAYNVMDELIPLYASAQLAVGGLGLASHQLALPLTAVGPIIIAWSIWGFPPLQHALGGTLPTIRVGILLAAPLTMLIPLASLAAGHVAASLGMLTVSFCLVRPIAASIYTCSMLLINSSGPSSQLGAINGAAQAAASASKALGPFAAGLIWGASLRLPFPGHHYLVFGVSSCILLLVELVYAAVRP